MIELHRLSNGIQVVLEPMEGVRSASIGIYVKAGSAYETRENNGIAHVIEHMMFKGTKMRSAKEIATVSSRMGGDLNAYTAKEETCYYATVLDEHLEEAVKLLGDMLLDSRFDEIELQRELEVILEEIDMYQDSPEDLAIEYLQKISMPDCSLGYFISGEKKVVSSFQRNDLLKFMDDFYTAERMVISIAGSLLDTERILELLEEKFSRIKPLGKKDKPMKTNFKQTFEILHKDTEQVHLALLFPSVSYNNPERFAQSIFDHCLGDSDDSRLFQRLREELGLVYSIYSFNSLYANTGIFQIYGAMNPQKAEKVLFEMGDILKELREKGITEEELNGAKSRLRAELLMELDSCQNRMSQNGKSLLLAGKLETTEEIVEQIMKVSVEEVHQFAKKYLKLSAASMVAVGGQKGKAEQKLREYWKEIM